MKPGDSSSPAAIGDGAAWPCPSVSSSGSPPSSAAAADEKPATYGGKDDDVAARGPRTGGRAASGARAGARAGGRLSGEQHTAKLLSMLVNGWIKNGGRRRGRQLRGDLPLGSCLGLGSWPLAGLAEMPMDATMRSPSWPLVGGLGAGCRPSALAYVGTERCQYHHSRLCIKGSRQGPGAPR